MKVNPVGIVDKVRFIGMFPEKLVRFTLLTSDGSINCVANGAIAEKIMLLEENTYTVSLFGHYNNRHQLIVDKLLVRNPSSFFIEYSKQIDLRKKEKQHVR